LPVYRRQLNISENQQWPIPAHAYVPIQLPGHVHTLATEASDVQVIAAGLCLQLYILQHRRRAVEFQPAEARLMQVNTQRQPDIGQIDVPAGFVLTVIGLGEYLNALGGQQIDTQPPASATPR